MDGVIWGLGGCKIASGHGARGVRDASLGTSAPVLACRGAEGVPLFLKVAGPFPFAVPLVRDQVRVAAFSVADRGWLGRAQRLDLPIRVAAAEFGIGGDGQVTGAGGGVLPVLPVSHCLGKGLFLLLVVIAHGSTTGGQVLVAGGAVVIVSLAGSVGFSVGADGAQSGVERGKPGQP
jgi:hypothetical protein